LSKTGPAPHIAARSRWNILITMRQRNWLNEGFLRVEIVTERPAGSCPFAHVCARSAKGASGVSCGCSARPVSARRFRPFFRTPMLDPASNRVRLFHAQKGMLEGKTGGGVSRGAGTSSGAASTSTSGAPEVRPCLRFRIPCLYLPCPDFVPAFSTG